MADLVQVLSRLYETAPKARSIADGLIRLELVNTEGCAVAVWPRLLREAHKCGRLRDLVGRVSDHYPEQKALLQSALSNYEAAMKQDSVYLHSPVTHGDTNSTPAFLASSPFYVAGGMGPEIQSYVERDCDRSLKTVAVAHPFIWLQGDFQFGKTSLLNRHGSWLGNDWIAITIDLQLCDHSTNVRFRNDFFSEIAEALGTPCAWRTLRGLLQHRKVAFLLDELGACTYPQILELVERFHSLAEKAPGHLKLVVALREDPSAFLSRCGVRNPKHRDAWKVIHLDVLTLDEVVKLINLFPPWLGSLLHARLDRIRTITHFRPHPVQHLFHRLWEDCQASCRHNEIIQLAIDDWLDSIDKQ